MFEPNDFIQYEDGVSRKTFGWYNMQIHCTLISSQTQSTYWYFEISGINKYAEDDLRLDHHIGATCNRRTLAAAMKRMFKNKYKDAYHKILVGVLCGKIINNTLYLGIK